MSDTPKEIQTALQHVKIHHPKITKVTFAQEDDEHGGFWQYADANGETPTFGPEIDVSILEEALDVAWDDRTFPATYEIAEGPA
jgi:hypothetical protein